jgi:hypothetical protein
MGYEARPPHRPQLLPGQVETRSTVDVDVEPTMPERPTSTATADDGDAAAAVAANGGANHRDNQPAAWARWGPGAGAHRVTTARRVADGLVNKVSAAENADSAFVANSLSTKEVAWQASGRGRDDERALAWLCAPSAPNAERWTLDGAGSVSRGGVPPSGLCDTTVSNGLTS